MFSPSIKSKYKLCIKKRIFIIIIIKNERHLLRSVIRAVINFVQMSL